jgi:hypothetical protein
LALGPVLCKIARPFDFFVQPAIPQTEDFVRPSTHSGSPRQIP